MAILSCNLIRRPKPSSVSRLISTSFHLSVSFTCLPLLIGPISVSLMAFCASAQQLTSTIGNARLAGLEKDLGLSGYDYNMVLSIFYISYILFEIPVTMFCKLIGPGWFLPGTTLAFGVVSIGTAFTTNRASICGVRFVLGVFEAGKKLT